ncbi:MAG: hypothetical protein IPL49_07680 [Saprospirales bacterium]|nr:hypothetical protein [Saprospirales bacterium]MBK8490764.1 hypothetical protein [Saprospirales bacterium]
MRNPLYIWGLVLLGVTPIAAQPPGATTLFDLLYLPDSPVEIVLQTSWDSLAAIRKTDREIEGKLIFQKNNGQMAEWKINISVRGKFRRRICDVPPLKLDFSKKDLEAEGLLPLDKMKLVTHCLEDPLSDERIYREHLIYQMYQLLSPYSFRTQLVRVKYVDMDHVQPSVSHYGILIEDDQVLANRLGLERIDTLNLSAGDFPEYQAEVQALFQYLIGNSDWDMQMCRNLEILEDRRAGKFHLVPYDFDFSGFVNAPYAVPNPDFQLAHLRERIYQGGTPPSTHARMMVLSQKKAFYKLIRKYPQLSPEARYDCLNYLSSGFRDIKRNKLAFPILSSQQK